MTHITSELLSNKNLSLWLICTAIMAFASGYSLASFQNSDRMAASSPKSGAQGLANGKYGHLTFHP